jgi:cystathionine beta-lyase
MADNKFDFDKLVERRYSGSVKWEAVDDVTLPLWVADMDFEAAPAIRQALAKRVEHGVLAIRSGRRLLRRLISWFSEDITGTCAPLDYLHQGWCQAVSCAIKA